MNGGRQRAHGASDGRKERDDDLVLFRELFKREEQRNVSLLQPVSDDFEATNGSLYKMPSVKRGMGFEFLSIDNEKEDYDWLKTPPATPLFPSLENENSDSNIVEIPILQPIKTSRFAGRKQEGPNSGHRPKTPGSRSASSSRSVTPNRRPNSSAAKESPNPKQSPNQINPSLPIAEKSPKPSSGISAAVNIKNSDKKPLSRGTSPIVRSRTPAVAPRFPDYPPPNPVTAAERASSASRCRPSCSPRSARGRRTADVAGARVPATADVAGARVPAASVGNVVVGSRMVEKLMNARRPGDPKTRQGTTEIESPGFGRLMTRTSLDVAHKHMEIRKDPNYQQPRVKSTAVVSNVRSNSDDSRKLWGSKKH